MDSAPEPPARYNRQGQLYCQLASPCCLRIAAVDARGASCQGQGLISTRFNTKQRIFLDFVLSHYVSVGVEEPDQEKLRPLLSLKYHNSITDAVADLGKPEEISKAFTGFQKFLYQETA
jgi:hypothetical protein